MKRLFDTGLFVPDDDKHFSTAKGGASAVLAYQADRLLLAQSRLRTRDVAIDVGAHVGLLTRQLLQIFPRVIAFEPSPANYECLSKNLSAVATAQPHSLWLARVALSACNGRAGVCGGGDNSGDTWIAHNADGGVIEVARFDDWTQANDGLTGRTLSLVKIDVQGCEWAVLRGMEQTLRDHKPVVIVECEKKMPSERFGIRDDAARLFLESLGAVEFGKISADYLYHWPEAA